MANTDSGTDAAKSATAGAPLDGTPILGWWHGAWFPMRWEQYPPNRRLWGWRILPWEGGEFLFYASPDFWMPMPPVPQAGSEAAMLIRLPPMRARP